MTCCLLRRAILNGLDRCYRTASKFFQSDHVTHVIRHMWFSSSQRPQLQFFCGNTQTLSSLKTGESPKTIENPYFLGIITGQSYLQNCIDFGRQRVRDTSPAGGEGRHSSGVWSGHDWPRGHRRPPGRWCQYASRFLDPKNINYLGFNEWTYKQWSEQT